MLPKYRTIQWTEHSKIKMRQYGLSKSKLMNVLRKPERKEQGIADGTLAVMQTNKSFSKNLSAGRQGKKPAGELWLMYKDTDQDRRIISAWRYPGISKPGEAIPMPEDIRRQLESETELI